MLETNYSELFARLLNEAIWRIELPEGMSDFFERGGYTAPNRFDVRRCPRIRSRHRAILYFVAPLPAFPRPPGPVPIYTNDLSRTGFGCLCSEQLYPGEHVHILLPNCWMEVTVARSRRIGPRCFESGALLKAVHLPDSEGFALPPASACLML